MTTVPRPETADGMNSRILNGALAGLAGGVVFGLMMGMMQMLPMVAGLVGSQSPVVGFIVHMVISAIIGAIYGVVLGGATTSWGTALGLGAIYGLVWWFLGPLLIMPTMMGMGPQLNATAMAEQMPSLIGHLIYGVITGATFFWLTHR
ncbi:MAG: hypothetical protein ACRDIB_10605 [Ardenticatenaceae bacterium]